MASQLKADHDASDRHAHQHTNMEAAGASVTQVDTLIVGPPEAEHDAFDGRTHLQTDHAAAGAPKTATTATLSAVPPSARDIAPLRGCAQQHCSQAAMVHKQRIKRQKSRPHRLEQLWHRGNANIHPKVKEAVQQEWQAGCSWHSSSETKINKNGWTA